MKREKITIDKFDLSAGHHVQCFGPAAGRIVQQGEHHESVVEGIQQEVDMRKMPKQGMVKTFIEQDIRPNKQSWLIGGTLVSAVVALIIGKVWWENTRTYPAIVYPNKAIFYQGGWFFNGRTYDLHRLNGQWYFNGEEFAVPMEGPWGGAYVLRFEDRGRVYRVNKSDATRTELRIVNGEWSERCDDGSWVSIYTYDDY